MVLSLVFLFGVCMFPVCVCVFLHFPPTVQKHYVTVYFELTLGVNVSMNDCLFPND